MAETKIDDKTLGFVYGFVATALLAGVAALSINAQKPQNPPVIPPAVAPAKPEPPPLPKSVTIHPTLFDVVCPYCRNQFRVSVTGADTGAVVPKSSVLVIPKYDPQGTGKLK